MFRKLRLRLRLARAGLSRNLKEKTFTTVVRKRELGLQHSPFNSRWFGELGVTPKVILDLGSFDGGDAYRFATTFTDCRVVSVEADPVRFESIMASLGDTRIEFLNRAISNVDGPIDWYAATVGGDIYAQGSLYQHSESYKTTFPAVCQNAEASKVTAVRIDSLCETLHVSDIDLLHMDIEGAEYAAVKSLGAIRPKLIFAEMCQDRFVGIESTEEVHQYILKLGYEMVVNLGHDRLYRYVAS